ncbi:hypothetical protein FRB93_010914 [Tulasnella sp. JGI-2019a]|nr:hypothetical protein FRB93_010914 [Tulasnella sp. JGI-2019a]
MSTITSPATSSLPTYTNDDAQALFDVHTPSPYQLSSLRLPLCIPQLSIGIEAPFARAYSSELIQSGIEQEDLLKFIDGLNTAMLASPPLRVLDTVGKVIGMVPYHWTIIASIAIQTGAKAGAKALSKGLTDRYLRIANEAYFAPRGLRVRLCRTPAVRQLIGLDPTKDSKSSSFSESLKTTGMMVENVGLSVPIVRNAIVRLHPAPSVDTRIVPDATRRRVASLEGRCLPLEYDMPLPTKPNGKIEQMNALGVKMNVWQDERSKAKANRARDMLASHQTGAPLPPSGPSNMLGGFLSGTRIGSRLNQLSQRREARIAGSQIGARRLKSKVAVADRKELSATMGMLWIVVINAEQDKALQGTELADNDDDVDVIGTEEWQNELDMEDEEDDEALELTEEKAS